MQHTSHQVCCVLSCQPGILIIVKDDRLTSMALAIHCCWPGRLDLNGRLLSPIADYTNWFLGYVDPLTIVLFENPPNFGRTSINSFVRLLILDCPFSSGLKPDVFRLLVVRCERCDIWLTRDGYFNHSRRCGLSRSDLSDDSDSDDDNPCEFPFHPNVCLC